MKYLLIIIIVLLCTVAYKPKCEHIYAPVARMGVPSQQVDNMLVCVKCYSTLLINAPKCIELWRHSADSVFLGGSRILIQH